MKVNPTSSIARIQQGADITDGPVLTKGERRFVAEQVWAAYILDTDGWRLQHIDVTGRIIKKDGTLGVAQMTCSWHRYAVELPEWVVELSRALAPQGDTLFPGSEFEVKA